MNISETTLESSINELVDRLDKDNEAGTLKMLNDDLFILDMDSDIDNELNIGKPLENEDDKIILI